jgi:hypothetical protein
MLICQLPGLSFDGLAASASYFDGTDRLVRSQGGDFKTAPFGSWSGCCWIGAPVSGKYICSALYDLSSQGSISMYVYVDANGLVNVAYSDDGNQVGKSIRSTTSPVIAGDKWNFIAWSIDIEEGFDGIQVNDETGYEVVSDSTAGPVEIYTNRGVYGIGDLGNTNTSSKFIGGMYNLWHRRGAFENISSDISAFVNSGTDYSPRNLGLNGTATGLTQPDICMNRPFNSFQVNGGAAGTPCTLFGALTSATKPSIPGSAL